MMQTIIQCLGSAVLDKREVGGKTLGDLVSKLGDRVLPDIIPILDKVRRKMCTSRMTQSLIKLLPSHL